MKRRILLASGVALLLAACKTTAPVTIETNQTTAASAAQMKKAIYLAASSKGWRLKEINSKTIQAAYIKNSGSGIIDITYDRNGYKINVNKASTLMDANGNVHKNLNRWIRNLDKSIQQELLKLQING